MPANNTPIFVLTPKIGQALVNTANTNRDGTGSLGSVITGATNGTRVDRVVVKASVNTTNGMVRLFIYDGASVYTLYDEVPVNPINVSAQVAGFKSTLSSPDLSAPYLVLPNGYILKAGTHNAEMFHVTAQAFDY